MRLLELQRRVAGAVMSPLTPSGGIAPKTAGGRPMRAEANELIKPNTRLTSLERLEIYSRQYWFRVLDSLYEDFPGLCAVLGPRAFDRLATAYLTDVPSRSFTLRNLGSRLERWLKDHPGYAGNNLALALDMVRLEWAHIEAFDGAAEKVLGPEDLLELSPELKLRLQPHITLLELRYPVDDVRIQINAISEGHGAASNAVRRQRERRIVRRCIRLKPEPVFLAVHRLDFTIYYRRLEAEEFHLLDALRRGRPIGETVEIVCKSGAMPLDELQRRIENWFAAWARLGWFWQPIDTRRNEQET